MFSSFSQSNSAQQQQPGSQFGSSSGQFGAQQSQQQQQQAPQRPGLGSPMTIQELSRGSQQQFGQQPQAQQYNQMGSFAQPQQQQAQPYAAGQSSFGYQQQHQQPQQVGQWGAYGQQQQQQQQQPYPHTQQAPSYGNYNSSHSQIQQYQPNMSYSQPGQQGIEHHQATTASPAQHTYLPGYLSRLKSQRPYSPSATRHAHDGSSPDGSPQEDLSVGIAGTGTSTTPNLRSSRDDGRRTSFDASPAGIGGASASSAHPPGGPTSPVQGFSSSFFNTSPGGDDGRSLAGNESIFGAGGLRGGGRNRKSLFGVSGRGADGLTGTPSRDGMTRSSSFLRSSSVGSPPSGDRRHPYDGDEDDDDAPPSEALTDAAGPVGASSSGRGSGAGMANDGGDGSSYMGAVHGNTPANVALGGPKARDMIEDGGQSASSTSTLCVLLLYGFPASGRHAVIAHFSSVGEVVSQESLSGTEDASSECVRITYASPLSSLRALRRSGELVAGIAYVGVRFADDTLHREMLLNGLNAVARSGSQSLGGSGIEAKPSSSSTATATVNSSSGAGAKRASTPYNASSFGRPISIIDSPGAALRPPKSQTLSGSSSVSNSPFGRLSSSLFGSSNGGSMNGSANNSAGGTPLKAGTSANGTTGSNPGMMGRLGDAIFGW